MKKQDWVSLAVLSVMCAIAALGSGCATMERLGLKQNDLEVLAVQLIEREGLGDQYTKDEVHIFAEWIRQDWETNQERQGKIEEILAREQYAAFVNEKMGKYRAGGEWVNINKPAPAVEPAFEMTYGRHKGKTPTVDPSVTLRSVTLIGGKLHIDVDPLPWGTFTDNEKELAGWVARGMADGTAGTFEMCRAQPSPRSLHNINEGFEGNPPWSESEWVCLVNKAGTLRTNWVKVQQ